MKRHLGPVTPLADKLPDREFVRCLADMQKVS